MKLFTLLSLLTLSGMAFAMDKEKSEYKLPEQYTYERDVEIHGQDTADYFQERQTEDRQESRENAISDDRDQQVRDDFDAAKDAQDHEDCVASGKTY